MKKLLPLLCAFLCALPALAQNEEPPKELGFNFGYQYSEETRVSSANLATQRNFAGAKPVTFEETVAGKKGVIERETLSFLDGEGAVLGTLNSAFDGSGHLTGQSLTEGTTPARALNWFATGAQSPVLTIKGSFLSARYTTQNGFLRERVLTLKLPAGTRTMKTIYDAMGRRERDITDRAASDPIKSALTVQFFYDESGLNRFRAPSGPDGQMTEATLERNVAGQIARMTAKSEGVLQFRSTVLFDEKGKSTGFKMENFDDGILSRVVVTGGEGKSAIEETYEDGVLASRKTQKVEDETIQLVSLEEFDPKGQPAKRTDYDKNGAVSAVTTFNADGSVKETQKYNAGQ